MAMDQLNQAITIFNEGRHAQAEPILRRILAKKPNEPRACALMAQIFDARHQFDQAEHFYQRGFRGEPDAPYLWMAYGQSLLARKERERSLEAHLRAHALGHPLAQLGLCEVLCTLDRYEEAADHGIAALSRNPDRSEIYQALGGALAMNGRLIESLLTLQRGVEVFPNSPVMHSAFLTTLLYDPGQTGASIREAHEHVGRHLARLFPESPVPFRNTPDPDRPIRIGILSSDFRKHAVASFIGAWVTHHDRERYPLYAYHTGPADALSGTFQAAASRWTHLHNVPDERVIETIRRDGIDVLVELNGHSPGGRMVTLLTRAAPVQATYLGYAATTGLPTMDYRIVDRWTDPPEFDAHASERLARLDRCFVCFDPPGAAPDVRPLAALEPGAPLTIGSFSTLFKVSPQWLDFWGRMIEAHPGWRLLFKNQSLGDEGTRRRVRAQIVGSRAIGDRVEFLPATKTFRDHLDLYNRLDIVLDVKPYVGTTTTCDALWMGAPSVTLPGPAHHANVGVSLMRAVGLEEFIARDEEDFVRIIERFDADRPRLAEIRAGLRERVRRSDLGDAPGLARALEGAVRDMWRAWCNGSLPGGKRP